MVLSWEPADEVLTMNKEAACILYMQFEMKKKLFMYLCQCIHVEAMLSREGSVL